MKKTSVQKRRPSPRAPEPKRARNVRGASRKPSRGRPRAGAAVPAEPSVPPAPPAPVAESVDIVLSTPEVAFTTRPLPPEPERPLPARRRAIFFDVENTSRPEHISRVFDHLALDWSSWRTDLIAVGNWKVIGRDTARLLARHGAHLIHSAPSVGVSDWSDLRIGVAAGVWLARARPGDVLEIITNDRAFDAVGDVAASLGIGFKRLTHHGLPGVVSHEDDGPAPARASASDGQARRRSRGRRRRGWGEAAPAMAATPPPPRPLERVVVEPSTERSGRGRAFRAHRASRRDHPHGARPHAAVAHAHGHDRHTGQRAEGSRVQPNSRVATAHHAPQTHQGDQHKQVRRDYPGGRERGGGGPAGGVERNVPGHRPRGDGGFGRTRSARPIRFSSCAQADTPSATRLARTSPPAPCRSAYSLRRVLIRSIASTVSGRWPNADSRK